MPNDPIKPKTVGDLRVYSVEIQCRRCGRAAAIDPDKMTTARGRAIDRRLPVTQFIAKLKCASKACGEKPERLYLSVPAPRGQGETTREVHRWAISLRGQWTYLGATEGD